MHLEEQCRRERELASKQREKYLREKAKVEGLEHQLRDLKKDWESLNKWALDVHSENEQFRTEIVTMGSGRGPIRAEEYYTQSFLELKGSIELRIVKLSKAHANHFLEESEQTEILDRISKLGEHGMKTAKSLRSGKYSLPILYGNGRRRHPLIRQIVALFLLNQVFEPFAVGISQEFSNGLKAVETDIMQQGFALDTEN